MTHGVTQVTGALALLGVSDGTNPCFLSHRAHKRPTPGNNPLVSKAIASHWLRAVSAVLLSTICLSACGGTDSESNQPETTEEKSADDPGEQVAADTAADEACSFWYEATWLLFQAAQPDGPDGFVISDSEWQEINKNLEAALSATEQDLNDDDVAELNVALTSVLEAWSQGEALGAPEATGRAGDLCVETLQVPMPEKLETMADSLDTGTESDAASGDVGVGTPGDLESNNETEVDQTSDEESEGDVSLPTSAEEIADAMALEMKVITKVVYITEENDSNELLGRPTGYTSAAVLHDRRFSPGETDETSVNNGATIEVFSTARLADARKAYIDGISENLSLVAQYTHTLGPALIRADYRLSPSQWNRYIAVFEGVQGVENGAL